MLYGIQIRKLDDPKSQKNKIRFCDDSVEFFGEGQIREGY